MWIFFRNNFCSSQAKKSIWNFGAFVTWEESLIVEIVKQPEFGWSSLVCVNTKDTEKISERRLLYLQM
jgi:hypothetical protein